MHKKNFFHYLYKTEVSPLLPVKTNKVDYVIQKKVLFRDQSWLFCFSTSNTYDPTYRISRKFAYADNLACCTLLET